MFHLRPRQSRSLRADENEIQSLHGTNLHVHGTPSAALPPGTVVQVAASHDVTWDFGEFGGRAVALTREDVLAAPARPVFSTQEGAESICARLVDADADETGKIMLYEMGPPPSGPRTSASKEPASPEIIAAYPSLFREGSVAGSLANTGGAWQRQFPNDPWARMADEGADLGFDETVVGRYQDYHKVTMVEPYPMNDARQRAVMDAAVEGYVRDRVVEDVTALQDDPREVTIVNAMFVIEQGTKSRPVMDARPVNALLAQVGFKMESAKTAARVVDSWTWSADMRSGYHQVSLREDQRRFCCFRWNERVYRWRVLPFGVSSAPRIFQKIMLLLFGSWRAQGLACVTYLDDGLHTAATHAVCCQNRHLVLSDMQRLGVVLNRDKVRLEPSPVTEFLGLEFDKSGPELRLYVTDKRLRKIEGQIDALLHRAKQGDLVVKGLELASLLGRLISVQLAVPPVRLLTRELLAALRQLELRELQLAGRILRVRDYSGQVKLHAGALIELAKLRTIRSMNGAKWHSSTPTRILSTDGSGFGHGGVVRAVTDGREGGVLSWAGAEHPLSLKERSSARTEMEAILRQLILHMQELMGHAVLHRTDSMSSLFGLRNGGFALGENRDLNLIIKKIWIACDVLGIRLMSEYVGSEGIIYSGADALSRPQREDRTRLLPSMFREMVAVAGVQPCKDLFAEAGGNQGGLPYYSSAIEEVPTAQWRGRDALSRAWFGCCYAFPPMELMFVVVEKALREVESGRCSCVLLVGPQWPRQPWYPLLGRYPSVALGPAALATTKPDGAYRPIDSEATWNGTHLRGWIIKK